ncbi:docking protein 2 [Aulostomus maculatus]
MWMVLFDPGPAGVGQLELFTAGRKGATTEPRVGRPKTVVQLRDCVSVTPALRKSCPQGCTAFYLNTFQSTYTLASTESQAWMSALSQLAFQVQILPPLLSLPRMLFYFGKGGDKLYPHPDKDPGGSLEGGFERGNDLTMKDNDLYASWKADVKPPPNQFQVTVQDTQASVRCQLAGEYLISPNTEAVVLLDIHTGHVIHQWPYTLIRKFGKVKGGFSIEAGHRCETGQGVFVFLSARAPQIFQAISRHCLMEGTSSMEPHSRSLSDQFPAHLPTATHQHTRPPRCSPADSEDADCYSTITKISVVHVEQPPLIKPPITNSKEQAAGEGDDEECERCHLNLDNVTGDNIYYNLRRAPTPMNKKGQLFPEIDRVGCIYPDVKGAEEEFCTPLPSSSHPPPMKPRLQRQPPVNNYIHAQAQPADDMTEMEEVISSSTGVTPSEAPGTFKHRLAEIISKDLAKFHLPSGAGSPTDCQ